MEYDINKLHAEMTQYIDHGFQIAMAAITVTGVVGGWMITRNDIEPDIFLIGILLDLILGALFFMSYATANNLQLLCSYLEIMGLSNGSTTSGCSKKTGERSLRPSLPFASGNGSVTF